jgi:hypothetical protein
VSASLLAFYQFPECVFSGLASASFLVFFHRSENPLNGATVLSTLASFELSRQTVEKASAQETRLISAATYIGCTVKNINSFFLSDRVNAQSLLKKVRLEACGHAFENLTKFGLSSRVQHTHGFRFAAIDSSADS